MDVLWCLLVKICHCHSANPWEVVVLAAVKLEFPDRSEVMVAIPRELGVSVPGR